MPSRSNRNKNPGNIRTSGWIKTFQGYKGQDSAGFAIFETPAHGVAALARLLTGGVYINLTVGQALSRYAPKNENDTETYIKYVCDNAEVSPVQTIGELDPFAFLRMVAFMCKMEGWHE